jgi:hypothetical protein
MSIYTNGYAIGGISTAALAGIVAAIKVPDAGYTLADIIPDMPYKQWAGTAVEVKGFAGGIYLDGDFRFSEDYLTALSQQAAGVLYLCFYEDMNIYGCSYYLNGKKMLERVTVDSNNLTDGEAGNEFNGHPTATVIHQLFNRLTGGSLLEAVETKGQLYFFKTINSK